MDTFLPARHPVEDDIRHRIMQTLREIEQQHDITVLYACESGSRAWGFASPDSDYDVRFIYVHRLPWYLAVEPRRDVIELPILDTLDVSGWELRKTLQLLLRSNPVVPEWLDSPIVYMEQPKMVDHLRALTKTCFSPLKGYHHYLSMARRTFRDHMDGETVKLKKYLYALRPLLAARWIESRREQPPMRFALLAEAMLDDAALKEEIARLLDVKMRSGEAKFGPRWPRIHTFIETELSRLARSEPENSPKQPTDALDRFLMETVLACDARQAE